MYRSRDSIGHCINRELKTDLGLGEHQVSKDERRIEKSFGIAVLAHLLLPERAIRRSSRARRSIACFSIRFVSV